MDLTLPLVGILGVIGYNLNNQPNSREYIDKRVKIPVSELPSGKSIYESRKFARTQQAERKVYEKVRKNNEIVTFNSKSDAKVSTILKNPKKVTFAEPSQNNYKEPEKLVPNNKIFNGPMFSSEKYFIPESTSKEFNTVEKFDDISSLSGQKLNLTHQNMQPFFSGKVKNQTSSNTLGRYTGRDYQPAKKEVEAIRNGPVNNVYGSVLFTDSIQQDRFVASNNHATLLPFEQVRVQPIPGEYNRGSYKTIEELRTVNPRTTLEGRLTPGKTIDKRAILGELQQVRVPTDYELGESRQFRTTGEDAGAYYEDTDHYRETRKNIIAEAKFNQNSAVNYAAGDIIRASKKDDGRNTIVQEDKRGNFRGDWIRSRKNTTGPDSIPTNENYTLRKQERETGNRAGTGNVMSKIRGTVNRYEEALKTTNKELSLYTYKGGANGNSIKKPEDRGAWYSNSTKTKESREHTPGGKKANAPGIGVGDVNFDIRDRTLPKNYNGPSAVLIQPSTSSNALGEISKSKIDQGNNNRLDQKFQPKTFDRLYGTLSNNLKE